MNEKKVDIGISIGIDFVLVLQLVEPSPFHGRYDTFKTTTTE
jgi:hypothetical protein